MARKDGQKPVTPEIPETDVRGPGPEVTTNVDDSHEEHLMVAFNGETDAEVIERARREVGAEEGSPGASRTLREGGEAKRDAAVKEAFPTPEPDPSEPGVGPIEALRKKTGLTTTQIAAKANKMIASGDPTLKAKGEAILEFL